jgi:hypothetical protein
MRLVRNLDGIGPSGRIPRRLRSFINPDPWGRTLFVDSTHTRASNARSGQDPAHPLATLVNAVSKARAHDQIIVGTGHEETVIAVDGLDISVDDLTIIGMGEGNRRPKIEVGTAIAGNVLISGDGVHMSNIWIDGALDAITKLCEVTGDDCVLDDWLLTQTTGQPVTGILLTTADRCKIIGLEAIQDGAGATRCIDLVGGDRVEIAHCLIRGNFSGGDISNSATALTHLNMHHNSLENVHANDQNIVLQATTDGLIALNLCRIATDVQTTWITAADCDWFENYGVNVDGETGVLIGTASA